MNLKKILSVPVFPATVSFLLLTLSSNLFSQANRFLVTNVSVKPEYVETADIKSSNVTTYGNIAKWIQINIDFKTPLKQAENEKNKFEYIDNVRVDVELLLPTGNTQKQYALLSGRADYWAFAMDGKEHHIVMFVPPQIISRWAPGQKFSSGDIKKLDIKVTFKYNDAIIGGGFHVPRGKTDAEVARMFQATATLTALDRVKNGIYPIDKTPWAHLNFDYYELIKVDFRSQD